MSEASRKEYLSRIHRAQDFIDRNLSQNLTLEEIARAACFSPYHFHRLFTSLTGESLYQFITRLRLEKAATSLRQQLEQPITQIALEVGFSSASTFARAFQLHFGMSASDFRKNCKADRKESKESASVYTYLDSMAFPPSQGKNMNQSVTSITPISIEVRNLNAKSFAYLRHVGPYAGNNELFGGLIGQLCAWAGPRGLFGKPGAEMLCIYHDNPDITEEAKLRISLGLTVDPGTSVSPPFNIMEIPKGKYVCAKFEIDPKDYGPAWAYVMGEWMASSGYQPDDLPCYECYLNDPAKHPEGKHLVEIRCGVKLLNR